MRLFRAANSNSTEQNCFDNEDGKMCLQSYVAWYGGLSMAEADDLLRETRERQAWQYPLSAKKRPENER